MDRDRLEIKPHKSLLPATRVGVFPANFCNGSLFSQGLKRDHSLSISEVFQRPHFLGDKDPIAGLLPRSYKSLRMYDVCIGSRTSGKKSTCYRQNLSSCSSAFFTLLGSS